MEHVIETVGFDAGNEGPTTSLTRQEVLHFACMLGHEECVKESHDRFISLKNGNWLVSIFC